MNHIELFDPTRISIPGWTKTKGNIIENRHLGVRIFHVMWVDLRDEVAYDQILRAEKGGGIFLPVKDKKIGLKKIWRPQATNQAEYANTFPVIDLSKLGRWSYEAPRGFAHVKDCNAITTARREAEEETESAVVSAENLGLICDNTAFSPHFTQLVCGKIDLAHNSGLRADPNEGLIGGLEWFAREELLGLREKSLLYCAYTLSAIAVLWMEKPELFN
jgi:hypothetical protein